MPQLLVRGVVTRASDKPNISPKPSRFDLVAPPFPRNHARILYNNILIGADSSSTSGSNDYDSTKPNSYERFTFSGDTQITYTVDSNSPIDTICIGGHNLIGQVVRVFYDSNDSGMLKHLGSVTPETNDAIMFHFDTQYSAKRVAVRVESDEDHYIGYVSAGIALQLQRPFFSGHTPVTDSDVSDIQFNRTQSGNIISNSLVRRGYETSADLKNIDSGWFRTYFEPFKQSAKTVPFFFAWNLLEYPQDVGFCRVSQDINESFTGVRDLMQFNFNLLGV